MWFLYPSMLVREVYYYGVVCCPSVRLVSEPSGGLSNKNCLLTFLV